MLRLFKKHKMNKNSFNITINCSDNLIKPGLRDSEILENFERELKYTVNLEDYWEVGIKDISLMKSWFLLPVDQKVELIYYDKSNRGLYSLITSDECKVKKGNYTFENLTQIINEKIDDYFEKKDDKYIIKQKPDIDITYKPQIYYFKNKNRIFQKPGIINQSEEFFVRFQPYLSNLIGFQSDHLHDKILKLYNKYYEIERSSELPKIDLTSEKRIIFSINPIDENIIKTIYIFSDLVKHTNFNDKYEQFLQFINIPYDSKFGQQLFYHFENPNYYQLKSNSFSKISFNLFDNIRLNKKLNLVPILQGDLIITLHFRKILNAMPKIIDLEPLNVSEDDINLNKPEIHPLQLLINKTPNPINENENKTDIRQTSTAKPIVKNIPVKVNTPENPVMQNKPNVEQTKVNIPVDTDQQNKSNIEQNLKKSEPNDQSKSESSIPNETKVEQDKFEEDKDEDHVFSSRGSERKTNELKVLIKGYLYDEIYN